MDDPDDRLKARSESAGTCGHDGVPHAAAVSVMLTPKSRVETPEYVRMLGRMIRACGRRVAVADVESLSLLAGLHAQLDDSTRDAVRVLRREHGYSWTDIGRVMHVTRQAAQQRWGSK